MKTIVDQLRKAIRDSGESLYAIAKNSGVDISVLGRFVRGERGIDLRTAAKVCRYLGLTLANKKKEKSPRSLARS